LVELRKTAACGLASFARPQAAFLLETKKDRMPTSLVSPNHGKALHPV
jgi:hypothetical protein